SICGAKSYPCERFPSVGSFLDRGEAIPAARPAGERAPAGSPPTLPPPRPERPPPAPAPPRPPSHAPPGPPLRPAPPRTSPAPGAPPRAAAAGVVHTQEPAAPAAGELAARRPHHWTVQPRARRRDGGGPSRRCAPAHPVQRQGVLRSHTRARAGPGHPGGDRSGGALVSVPPPGAGDADTPVPQPAGDRGGAGGAAQYGPAEVHVAGAPRA